MKNDFFTKNNEFFYLAFSVIALITFFPLFSTGIATADDFHYYLTSRRGEVMQDASYFAQIAGRFYFYIVKPVYNLPYIWDNMVVVKIFQYLPIAMCFLLFAKIVNMITKSKGTAWLYLLLFLMTMQISKHTSLFVSYPFYFSFSFFLLLSSYYLLLRFYEGQKGRLLIFSALLFGIGLLFYETYILFLLFAAITIVARNLSLDIKLSGKIKNALIQFSPFLIIGIIYLAAYFIFRIYYPSRYTGTSFATKDVSIFSFFKVIWRLAYSSFPLTVYETSKNLFWDKSELVGGFSPVLLRLIVSARVEWIVKGIVVAFCGYKLLSMIPGIKIKTLLTISGMAVLLIFIPHIPLALTEKYTFFVEQGGMIGYVTTFFSFFGTLLFLTVLLSYLINLFNFNLIVKRTMITVFVAGFFICSVLTDYSNYMIAKDIRSANLRFYAIDELVKTDEFKSIPPKTPFYGKTMWDTPSYSAASLTEQDFNWYEYFQIRTGNIYPVGRDDRIFLEYSKRVPEIPWFIAARQAEKSEDIMLVLAAMHPLQQQDSVVDHFADRALVLYYSSYKTFTVSFRIKGDPCIISMPVQINHIHDTICVNGSVELNIYCTKKAHNATTFTIQAAGIDLNSIMISNMINPKNNYFYL